MKRNESTPQMANIFNDFLVATSLHGYGYLHSANSMTLKVIWIIVIVMMTGLGVMFVAINTEKYFKARIITNIESSTANLSVSEFSFSINLIAYTFNFATKKLTVGIEAHVYTFNFTVVTVIHIFRMLFGPLSLCAT